MSQIQKPKQCSKCKVIKPVSEFGASKQNRDRLSSHCRACVSERGRLWYQKNKERNHERTNRWRAENREKSREIQKRTRQKHIIKRMVYERARYSNNKEHFKSKSQAYVKANPEKYAGYFKKRISKTGYKGSDPIDYRFIANRDEMKCYLCGEQINRADLQFDHVQPLCKGGEHSYENIKAVHRKCNALKGKKTLEQFRELEALTNGQNAKN